MSSSLSHFSYMFPIGEQRGKMDEPPPPQKDASEIQTFLIQGLALALDWH